MFKQMLLEERVIAEKFKVYCEKHFISEIYDFLNKYYQWEANPKFASGYMDMEFTSSLLKFVSTYVEFDAFDSPDNGRAVSAEDTASTSTFSAPKPSLGEQPIVVGQRQSEAYQKSKPTFNKAKSEDTESKETESKGAKSEKDEINYHYVNFDGSETRELIRLYRLYKEDAGFAKAEYDSFLRELKKLAGIAEKMLAGDIKQFHREPSVTVVVKADAKVASSKAQDDTLASEDLSEAEKSELSAASSESTGAKGCFCIKAKA